MRGVWCGTCIHNVGAGGELDCEKVGGKGPPYMGVAVVPTGLCLQG